MREWAVGRVPLAAALAGTLAVVALWVAGSASSAAPTWGRTWSIVDHGTKGAAAGNDYPWSVTLLQQGGSLKSVGAPTPYTVTGSASGATAQFKAVGSGTYVATFVKVTMSKDGRTFTADWTDTEGNAGTAVGKAGAVTPLALPAPLGHLASARVISLQKRDPNGPEPELVVTRDGKPYTASATSMFEQGDQITTKDNTLLTVEFFEGGRVGVNEKTTIELGEGRDSKVVSSDPRRTVLDSGSAWADPSTKKGPPQPLEIQTNGGTLGIRDTGR